MGDGTLLFQHTASLSQEDVVMTANDIQHRLENAADPWSQANIGYASHGKHKQNVARVELRARAGRILAGKDFQDPGKDFTVFERSDWYFFQFSLLQTRFLVCTPDSIHCKKE